jgi:penicillin-binding protein 1C
MSRLKLWYTISGPFGRLVAGRMIALIKVCAMKLWQIVTPWHRFNRLRQVLMSGVLLWIVFIAADWMFPFPLPQSMGGEGKAFSQVITDREGRPLRVFADQSGIWRYPVANHQVSPLYIEAVLEYEDRWFYQHQGINPLAMLRAAGQWIYFGKIISGGSTLTMQTARVLDPHSRSVLGKFKQMFRALQLEWYFSKAEILNLYLNFAPFGGTIEGVQAASFAYLGKSADKLTHAEAALLAVLPQAPSRNRPERYPERAKSARNKVLDRLLTQNVWEESVIKEAKNEPVIAQYNTNPVIAPILARRLQKSNPKQQVIRSSLDQELQQTIQWLAKDYVQTLEQTTSAAVLVMDNQNGEVLAYIGSADFNDRERFGHVDMIAAIRSPGSTLKPFIYAWAMEEGLIHDMSLLMDVPTKFDDYQPQNFHRGFSGAVSVREALQQSLNVPVVQVLSHLGSDRFYAQAHSSGLPIKLRRAARPNLAMALGGVGLNLEQLVGAYSGLGRGGNSLQPVLIANQLAKSNRLFSPQSAWITYDMLSDIPLKSSNLARWTENKAQSLAWKTGTSYGFRDAWVIAASAQITVGVWVGKPDGSASINNYGRRVAVPLLEQIIENLPMSWLQKPPQPNGIVRNTICWPMGGLKGLTDAADCHQQHAAWLIDNTAPTTLKGMTDKPWSQLRQTLMIEPSGTWSHPGCASSMAQPKQVTLWPQALQPWLQTQWQDLKLLPNTTPECVPIGRVGQQLTILGVNQDAKLYAIAGVSSELAINLAVNGCSGHLTWFHNGRWVKNTECHESWQLSVTELGLHQLAVTDETGASAKVEFEYQR